MEICEFLNIKRETTYAPCSHLWLWFHAFHHKDRKHLWIMIPHAIWWNLWWMLIFLYQWSRYEHIKYLHSWIMPRSIVQAKSSITLMISNFMLFLFVFFLSFWVVRLGSVIALSFLSKSLPLLEIIRNPLRLLKGGHCLYFDTSHRWSSIDIYEILRCMHFYIFGNIWWVENRTEHWIGTLEKCSGYYINQSNHCTIL